MTAGKHEAGRRPGTGARSWELTSGTMKQREPSEAVSHKNILL